MTSAVTAVALMIYTAPMVTLPETAATLKTPLSAQAWLLNGTPLGLAALLLVAGSLADDYGRRRLFVSGTIAVVLLLGAAAVLTACFVVIERRGRNPMIELGLLRHPRFLVSLTGGLSTGLAVIGLFSYMPSLLQRSTGLSAIGTAWLLMLWSGLSFLTALQVRRLAIRITSRHQLALGFLLHAVGALALLGSIAAHSWTRLLPGLIVAGVGSGLLNAALPLISVDSVPPAKAAMGSGAQQTFRYIGSCAGVAMTIAIVTSARSVAHGADLAVIVSAVLSVLTALLVWVLKD